MLAASLVLEAMTAWTYWREQTQDIPSLYHSIHSKDATAAANPNPNPDPNPNPNPSPSPNPNPNPNPN